MSRTLKKLRRKRDNRVIAGVCGGLGEHFGVDPIIFRVLFVIIALADGIGIIAYGLFWFLVPYSHIVENNN